VNGRADIETKTLRAIGNPAERFAEDSLRLMRAIRFSTVLDFRIDPDTSDAIKKNASGLARISPERIRDEFNKIITSHRRSAGIRSLVDHGLMEYIIPEVLQLINCEQPPQWHPEGDVFEHTCIALDLLEEQESVPQCLAVLLHDIGKPPTQTFDEADQRIRFNGHDGVGAEMSEVILRRLKYSNKIIEDVSWIVNRHMQFMNVQNMRTAKVKRFMSSEIFELEMELHRVDCASSNGFTKNYDYLRRKAKEFANEPLIPTPLITGKDLIDRGFQPSPQFKNILNAIQTEQLENRITTREEAIVYLEKHFL